MTWYDKNETPVNFWACVWDTIKLSSTFAYLYIGMITKVIAEHERNLRNWNANNLGCSLQMLVTPSACAHNIYIFVVYGSSCKLLSLSKCGITQMKDAYILDNMKL